MKVWHSKMLHIFPHTERERERFPRVEHTPERGRGVLIHHHCGYMTDQRAGKREGGSEGGGIQGENTPSDDSRPCLPCVTCTPPGDKSLLSTGWLALGWITRHTILQRERRRFKRRVCVCVCDRQLCMCYVFCCHMQICVCSIHPGVSVKPWVIHGHNTVGGHGDATITNAHTNTTKWISFYRVKLM